MEKEPGQISLPGLKQQKISGIFREKRKRDSEVSFGNKTEEQRNLANNLSQENKPDMIEPSGMFCFDEFCYEFESIS